jgi:hypothetical protein
MIVPLTRPASEFQLTRSWIWKRFATVVRSDAAEELQQAVLALNAYLPERHQHSTAAPPIGSSQRNILSIIRAVEFAIARLGSAAMPARHGPSSVGAATRTPFSP